MENWCPRLLWRTKILADEADQRGQVRNASVTRGCVSFAGETQQPLLSVLGFFLWRGGGFFWSKNTSSHSRTGMTGVSEKIWNNGFSLSMPMQQISVGAFTLRRPESERREKPSPLLLMNQYPALFIYLFLGGGGISRKHWALCCGDLNTFSWPHVLHKACLSRPSSW